MRGFKSRYSITGHFFQVEKVEKGSTVVGYIPLDYPLKYSVARLSKCNRTI